jgi:DNA-binding transcriptional MerR regulator
VADASGIYSIGAVCRMLDLSQPTIRSWEERYGVVVAERSEGGRRLYTRDHVAQLRFIKERLEEGLSAADAHRLLDERMQGNDGLVEAPAAHAAGRLLVLLAENDPYGAQLSDYFLRTEGYDVEVALSADEAEQKFASDDPALTIVDLMISGGVGRDLCRRLKQQRATPLLCISTLDLREQALAAGADAFLQKPLEPLRLVSAIKDLLGQSALVRTSTRAPG